MITDDEVDPAIARVIQVLQSVPQPVKDEIAKHVAELKADYDSRACDYRELQGIDEADVDEGRSPGETGVVEGESGQVLVPVCRDAAATWHQQYAGWETVHPYVSILSTFDTYWQVASDFAEEKLGEYVRGTLKGEFDPSDDCPIAEFLGRYGCFDVIANVLDTLLAR